jgi:pullulanase/glycogen debranching enzyme
LVDTFERCRLDWTELHEPPHREMLRLYTRLLQLRRQHPALRRRQRTSYDVRAVDAHVIAMERRHEHAAVLVVVRLSGHGPIVLHAQNSGDTLITSEDDDTTPDPHPIVTAWTSDNLTLTFSRPGAIVLQGQLAGTS